MDEIKTAEQPRTIQTVEQERNNAIFQMGLARYNSKLNESAEAENFEAAKKLQAEVNSLRSAAQAEMAAKIQAVAPQPPSRG